MMKKYLLVALLMMFSSSFAVNYHSSMMPMKTGLNDSFIGQWQNVDRNNPGVVQLNIEKAYNGALWINSYGKCQPRNCEWGKVAMQTLGQSVASPQNKYAVATWQPGFATKIVTIKKVASNKIQADVYTIFKDGSGRSNYLSQYIFKRVR